MAKKEKLDPTFVINEIKKCKKDPVYFFANYVLVPLEGTSEYVNLKLYDSQVKYINALLSLRRQTDKSGVIFLASRQCGKTRLTEAYIIWAMIFHNNYPAVFMTREKSPAGTRIIKQISEMIKRLPDWLHPEIVVDNATNVKLANNSEIVLQASKAETAKSTSQTKVRGFTPLLIWVDEAAFLPLQEHMEAIVGATSYSFKVAQQRGLPYGIILTSTPNGQIGVGKGFYDTWMDANENPDAAFIPVRLHWSEIPIYDEKWYKNKCKLLKDQRLINQEYELVFLGSNESIFADDIIAELTNANKCKEPIEDKYITSINGRVYWYSIPEPTKRYIIGVDTATSFGEDKSAVVVIDYETDQDVAIVIAKCAVDKFKSYLKEFVQHFNNYAIAIERNGVGTSIVESLFEDPLIKKHVVLDCKRDKFGQLVKTDKPGINSTKAVRSLAFDLVIETINESPNQVNSYLLRSQLASLTNKRGRIEGAEHDDLVVAFALALLAKYHYKAESYLSVPKEDVISSIFDTFYGQSNSIETNIEFLKQTNISMTNVEQYLKMKRALTRRKEPGDFIFEIGSKGVKDF